MNDPTPPTGATRRDFVASATLATAAVAVAATAGFPAILEGAAPLTLAPLPWAEGALEPVISSRTIGYHYGKHHKGYVDNLNGLIAGTPLEGQPLEAIVKAAAADPARCGRPSGPRDWRCRVHSAPCFLRLSPSCPPGLPLPPPPPTAPTARGRATGGRGPWRFAPRAGQHTPGGGNTYSGRDSRDRPWKSPPHTNARRLAPSCPRRQCALALPHPPDPRPHPSPRCPRVPREVYSKASTGLGSVPRPDPLRSPTPRPFPSARAVFLGKHVAPRPSGAHNT